MRHKYAPTCNCEQCNNVRACCQVMAYKIETCPAENLPELVAGTYETMCEMLGHRLTERLTVR